LNTWGREKDLNLGWRKFQRIFLKRYVLGHEVEQLKGEYLHLEMEGTDYRKYTSRFLKISGLIPDFTGSESKRIGRFIWGAHQDVRPNMRTAKPRTMQEATEMLGELTEEIIRTKGARGATVEWSVSLKVTHQGNGLVKIIKETRGLAKVEQRPERRRQRKITRNRGAKSAGLNDTGHGSATNRLPVSRAARRATWKPIVQELRRPPPTRMIKAKGPVL
jgi:hypothetical protein